MNRLLRRRFLALAVFGPALAFAAGPAAAAMLSLADISRYFNGFQTAQGDFTQINPDGSMSTGRIMIHRPGRVRFEYDPPDQDLVIASGGSVNIFDARSNQGPTVYPLRRTPLNLILEREVDLTRARMVVDHFRDGPTTVVVAQDPDNPEYGNIRLVFSAEPTELRQWVITDDMGRETTVILGDLGLDVQLRAGLFSIDDELRRRGLTSQR
ncbi:MAG: outer membrane lipoprotein carrier protein LolA [Pararhodobacter sp.]|nr:outer membrane lipoprotein carrier protein LolA [Pararhodobacter sp.]